MRTGTSFIASAAICLLCLPLHAADKESRAAGEAVYHSVGCERCHGPQWSGTEKGPDLRGVGKRLHRDQIEHQVRAGGGGMPAYGDVLNNAQVVQLVDFLESQKKAPKKSKAEVAPTGATTKPGDSE